MIGLLFLGFFVVYFLISFLVAKGTVGWAKKRGRSPWGWGFLSAFLMYNLVFWDWIPTMVLYSDYCGEDGGTVVYKTPAEWALENPELVGQLPRRKVNFHSAGSPNSFVDVMNDRVEFRTSSLMLWPKIKRMETVLFDVKSQKPLAREVQYGASCGGMQSVLDYRFWMPPCGCGVVEKRPQDFNLLMNKYTKIWENK